MIPASASSSNKAAAKKAIQVEDDNSPRRETRERRLWNEMLPSVPVGTELIKDFGPLGLFKGRVESFKYPFATIQYEDGDKEDLETRK
jgi:hypothetical protein